jgi:hypothetical protein
MNDQVLQNADNSLSTWETVSEGLLSMALVWRKLECKGVDWIQLDQKRLQWFTIVKREMDFRVYFTEIFVAPENHVQVTMSHILYKRIIKWKLLGLLNVDRIIRKVWQVTIWRRRETAETLTSAGVLISSHKTRKGVVRQILWLLKTTNIL